ncbi:AraC family transcriptional regulator [Caulobacter segnis]|uniref:AraC family transcriptional regulator n=1 Tax=Caulobacter segnis TaxID=88688 RepID=UPI00240FEC47|nr:AraC family transcriptional regulator [Caulobacter segnis]MDG2522578.1 AraC family transcriptional regulator [Caulobacter segnis]
MRDKLLAAANAYADANGGGENLFETPMGGVHLLRAYHRPMANRRLHQPSLCIVLQGGKQIMIGEETLDYGVMEALIVSMELPATGRIVDASPTEPFVGIVIDIDVSAMREVLEMMQAPPTPSPRSASSAFVTRIDDILGDCVLRLLRMADTPGAVPVLYPSVMREIYYWLLSGPHGGDICKKALPDSHTDRICRSILVLRNNFAQPLRVEDLAGEAGMSPSSYHQHFKALTSMSPIQFQKQLRLLEARRLMICDAANVAEAAYQVGYESPSHFSRDYARAFGLAPKRDAMNLRAVPG